MSAADGFPDDPRQDAGILAELARDTGCGDWETLRKPLARRNCRIHFLRSATSRHREIVLKIYRPGVAKPNLAKDLHAKSRACHAAATAAHGVPEPVFLSASANAWAMERILAPTAGRLLKNPFAGAANRDRIARAAGGWLGWFHARAPVAPQPFDAAYFLDKLAKLHAQTGPAGADPFLRKCQALAAAVATGLHGLAMPHVSAHGDFTPFNLFADGGKITGFDFLANRRLPVSFDLCRFLLYLDLYRLVPAGAAELREHGCRARDLDIFMTAYGGDHGWTRDGRWRRFQFLEVVRRLTSLALRRNEGRKSPFAVLETARVRRTARLLAEALGD